MRHPRLILSITLFCASPGLVGAQVIPTSEWVNLWSNASTLNTNPAPVNAVIHVYDPDGVLCGESLVHSPGSYGLVPVYRDDPMTPDLDEGAEPGDVLQITIDGSLARADGPDDAVWTRNGDVLRVDLFAERVMPTSEWVNFWSYSTYVRDEPVPSGAIVRAYDSDGVLCGEFAVVSPGSYGLLSVYRDDPSTVGFDEGADPGDILSFTINGSTTTVLGPDTPVWSENGRVMNVDLLVEGVSVFLIAAKVRPTSSAIEIEWSLVSPIDPGHLTLLRRMDDDATFDELTGLSINQCGTVYRTIDNAVVAGVTYGYRLKVSLAEGQTIFDLGSARVEPPSFRLLPSYPNPFRHAATIRFDLSTPSDVTLGAADVAGRLIRRLLDDRPFPAGRHEVIWDGRDDSGNAVPSGVYFMHISTGVSRRTGKVTLLR